MEPEPRRQKMVEQYRRHLREGLEQNIGLVIAKAVIGLVEAGKSPQVIARIGVEFGHPASAGGVAVRADHPDGDAQHSA